MMQTELSNDIVRKHKFLIGMYEDDYFPRFLVDKCKDVLINLCRKIETEKPGSLGELYKLSHAATDKLNDLQEEFEENGSEIETAARECIAEDFEFIAKAYGFETVDIEELIATRDW